jgi:hypothetical protein
MKKRPCKPTATNLTIHRLNNHPLPLVSTMKNISLSLALVLSALLCGLALAAPPSAPVGVCLQTQQGVTQCAVDEPSVPADDQTGTASSASQSGLFPGTNLKFRPGFIIAATENQLPSITESRWQQLFTTSSNRKASYRPSGVYGGVVRRLKWSRFYDDQSVRPKNPADHRDPAYDWSLLDAIFEINAVKNEGALVLIGIMEVGYGGTTYFAPAWLINAPYNGGFISTTGATRAIPQYYRYSGPDARGQMNVGASPAIVDEFVYFQQAMRDHLVSTGNIGKVMGIQTSEFYGGGDSGFESDFYHGVGTRAKKLYEIWAQAQIPVYQSSVSGGSTMTTILAQYVNSTKFGLTYPDMKLQDSGNSLVSRFSVDGTYQKDIRPLIQATEENGVRQNTFFAPGIANPWGYNGASIPQTASHILWSLSGPPKGVKKDSGLGQPGDDPAGALPVHSIIIDWESSSLDYAPTLEQWHEAIDTFGPPGTFAFPYIPMGSAQ